ncbi:MAG TPA: GAF domain-containing protein, partial [Anaerolineales bacterium]
MTTGLIVVLLVWLVLIVLPRAQTSKRSDISPLVLPGVEQAVDAVLILQPGGRVEYLNSLARQSFGLNEDESANLERLTRHVRPSDDFLDVCAAPGQKRVTVNGRLMEATSYQVPGTYPLMLISLRGMNLGPALSMEGGEDSGSILKVVTDFGQAIAASLDLGATLHAILDNVSRLVPSDLLELKIWDAYTQELIPYQLQETGAGTRKVVRLSNSQFALYTPRLISERRPFHTNEPLPALNGSTTPIQAYLGIPLLAGGELVGTLEAGQSSAAAFGQHNVDLLQLISGQAAVVIRNASLYDDEQQRVAELTGLANLNQAISAIQDPRDLFARLVESVAPLFEAEIVGFLLYDEARRVLEGQVPFRGLPPQIVQIYRAPIAPDSPAEAVLQNLQPILTTDASRDDQWRQLGLTDVAVAASLRDSALAPLISAGRAVGYLQVSHHRGGTAAFTGDELRLMNIVANQAATIIENALLVQQSRARSLRSDALRRIASLAASSATVDEILRYSAQELARLFQAEVGAVFLLDQDRGELLLQRGAAWGIPENAIDAFAGLYLNEPEFLDTVSHTQRPFLSGRLSIEQPLAAFYRPLVTSLQMESAVAVPLVVRDRSVGELVLASAQAEHFNSYDVQVVATAAGQLAAAIESAGLMLQTDESLQQRVEQLTAVARISRELSGSLDLKRLLEVIHDEGLRLIRADCASIQLITGSSQDGDLQVSLAAGCSQDAGLSILDRKVLQNAKSLIITDFQLQGEIPPHEGVRSALTVPITLQGEGVGLIHLHSNEPDFFDAYALNLVETLAGQAATAVTNARLYQDERQRGELMRRRAETLGNLTDVSYGLYSEQPLDQSLYSIARGIHESTPFRVVLISVYEPDSGLLRRVAGIGIQPDTLNELLARKQPLASLQQLMKPEFKISRSYYIPADQTPVLPADVHYVYSTYNIDPSVPAQNAWDPDDFLLIPLEDAQGKPLGLISLDDPANGLRPDRATVDALEVFAAQAALVMTNSARFSELQGRIVSLQDGVQRQQKLLSVSQNDLPLLLHKDLEQTISLHNLDRRAQRVRAGLAITESVSRQLDASSALMALGRETLTQLEMSAALVAEDTTDGPRLTHTLGSIPRATNVEALFGQRNPLRTVLQTGEMILIPNLDEDDEWRDTPLLTSLHAKGAVCIPVKVENRSVAAMLAISPEPMSTFTQEDRQVYHQISRQTSVILQNISLLNETRRRLQEVDLLLEFSRRLSGLTTDDMVKALLESARRALPAAHAGVVFLWNDQSQELFPRTVAGYADNASLLRLNYRSGEALPGITFAEKKTRRVDEINFARDYSLNAENLLLYRQATGGRLPVSSLLVPILAGVDALGLLVLDNFNTVAAFKPEDEALLLSLAQQVALSVENVRLVQATQERAGQLQALNDAAASMTSSLRSDQLVASLLDQLTPVLPYDTATLWLRDKDRLRVSAAAGFPDTEKRLGLTISVSDSALFNEMARTGQPISVGDVRQDPRFPAVGAPRLSWLGIPLLSKGELAGVLALEKWQAQYFSREYIQVATTFASQALVSLENARLYEESLNRAAELDQRSQR